MAELKTTRTDRDVAAFLAAVEDPTRRHDALEVCSLLQEVTGDQPAMWGPSIVGFGCNRYRNGSGRMMEWFVIGFSPRKQSLTLYVMDGFDGRDALLSRLGRHTTGKACLYLKRLSDVDRSVLRELVETSVARVQARAAGSGQQSVDAP
jgi:hypothetical protein